uniref:Uncharacterized protein n=1 Tax=Arundo donax TaxID=35708 RepID=A0A0A9FAG4_ARUDO
MRQARSISKICKMTQRELIQMGCYFKLKALLT